MGKKSRDKGNRIENEIKHAHRRGGIECHKVPLSGAVDGFAGDLRVVAGNRELVGESKGRNSGGGFRTVERWLGDNDMLFLRKDNAEPRVLITWELWLWLLQGRQTPEERTRVLTLVSEEEQKRVARRRRKAAVVGNGIDGERL